MRWITIVTVALAARGAAADTPVVLAVDGAKIYVDLGGKDGVGAGTELELLHVVTAKDPVTGKPLRDRFAIGTLTVERAGDHLAVATADPAVAKRVLPGDQVRLVGEAQTMRDPWQAKLDASRATTGAPVVATPSASSPRAQADAERVREAWQATLGKPLDERIARWRAFVDAHPQSAYLKVIRTEIASLEAQSARRAAALEKSTTGDDRDARIAALAAALVPHATEPLLLSPPSRVAPGQPLALSFLVRARIGTRAPVLYVRRAGDAGFRRLPLAADGDAYLRGEIPADLVAEPRLELFVEAAASDKAPPVPAFASRALPYTIAVDRGVDEPPIASGRSRITTLVDYVDFDGGLQDGFDQYIQAELDFMYRFVKPVYAFRLGFGSLSGIGGPKDVIDADPNQQCLDESGTYRCRRVTFNYVYTEIEHRFRKNVAVMIRPQAGLVTSDRQSGAASGRCDEADTTDCQFLTGLGVRGRIRFGEETSTNLVLGVAFTDGVGTLLEASYHWLAKPVVPVVLAVQVTDQPVPEDFGVRLIGDVGWRGTTWFYPSARISYQARDIDHGGLSGGAALNFDW
jgi:hypothetical protein